MAENASQQHSLKNQRSEDFVDAYSNNFAFESSVWDLRIIFGQLDQGLGIVDQHTGVTIPWPAVKLLIYYLQANVIAQEILNGKIRIAPSVVPPEPPPIPEEQEKNQAYKAMYEKCKELHAEFLKSL